MINGFFYIHLACSGVARFRLIVVQVPGKCEVTAHMLELVLVKLVLFLIYNLPAFVHEIGSSHSFVELM